MPEPAPEALQFLLSRRSRPAKTLTGPAPDRAAVQTILTAAARSPDHGMLTPWRFIVLSGDVLPRLADLAQTRMAALGYAEDRVAKAGAMFRAAPMMITVVATPVASEKVPQVEQTLSAGAVCLALVNAALASGWGANWLTGVMSTDTDFLQQGLSLQPDEYAAGFIVLGTETVKPAERARPDIDALTTWMVP